MSVASETPAQISRRRRVVTIAVMVIMLLGAISIVLVALLTPHKPGVGSGAGGGAQRSYIAQHTWAPQFQALCDASSPPGCSSTVSQDAGKFAIVAASTGYFSNAEVTRLRAENPGIVLLAYLNGTFKDAQDLGPNPDNTGTYPDCTAVLYDCSYAYTGLIGTTQPHSRIDAAAFPDHVLMNPVDPAWIKSRSDKCSAQSAPEKLSGCFFDNVGAASIATPGYVSPAVPFDSATLANWTATDWSTAVDNMLSTVRSAVKPGLVFGNGLTDGSDYFASTDPSSRLYASADGAMAEEFVKGPASAPSTDQTAWLADLRMLVDAGNRGQIILTSTRSWESPPASQAQKDAWHMYALGTFLLGSSQYSYFDYQYAHTMAAPTTWSNWWDADIGVPNGGYFPNGAVYERQFSKGLVAVNPSGNPVTVNVGSGYASIDGSQLPSTVTLAPQTAVIAIKLPAQTPPTPTSTLPTVGSNTAAVCGTWSLIQAETAAQITGNQTLASSLTTPGLKGLSVRVPWTAIDTDFSVLDAGYGLARANNLAYAVRFMAGIHTPTQYMGNSTTLASGQTIPLPWGAGSTPTSFVPNTVFEQAWEALAVKLAAYARAHGIRELHLPWFGGKYSELYLGPEVSAAPGYSFANALTGHERLLDFAVQLAGPDLAVEFPFTGIGTPTIDRDLANYIMATWGKNSPLVIEQGNNLKDTTPPPPGGGWAIYNGRQMYGTGDYNWTNVYQALVNRSSISLEIYDTSFNPSLPHAGVLRSEILSFASHCG